MRLMSTADPTTAEPRNPSPSVLLFGPPGTGKTSLLGALLQASLTQSEALGAMVEDPSGRLATIHDHVYGEGGLELTHTELVTYTLRLSPTTEEPVPPEVVLMDCDGKAALTVLKHPGAIAGGEVKGTVARAVVQSDAIALLVDASADDGELLAAFQDFTRFLDAIEEERSFAHEVGGFPVFLVLTQCDRLAVRSDDTARWEARVAARKKYVLTRFAEYLEDADPKAGVPSPYLPFGSVDLDVFAVALRRPVLADLPDPPDEPYGVAGLFRACFAAARAHRERAAASDRRLTWTLRSVGATVAVMLLGLVAVLFFHPTPGDPGLASRVELYRRQEPAEAAVRLAEKNTPREKRALSAFRNDPGFAFLPDELQDFVTGRLRELEDYRAYRQKLSAAMTPAETRSLEELARVEQQLTGELALPPEYAWGETEAGRLRDKWLTDVRLIREAEARWHDWFRELIRRATLLAVTSSFAGEWRADGAALLADAERPPFKLSDPIPGSPAVAQPRGEPVEYRVPYEFDRVYQARQDWGFGRDRLTNLRDLADALGLTGGPNRPEPVLDLPEPGPGVESNTLAGVRWAALRRQFPGQPDAYPEWDLRNFPEPGRTELARRVQRSFANGVGHAQRLIVSRMGPNPAAKDNSAGWREVAAFLGEPVFREWGRLLHLLARLSDPRAADPVAELAAFLRTDRFEFDLKGFELAIPMDLRERKVVPDGPLKITLTPRGGPPVVREFAHPPTDEGTRQGSVWVYRFTPPTNSKLLYRPGDGLTAELPVRVGGQSLRLAWEAGGTETFQFGRLTREPRLVRPGSPTERAEGVRLTPAEGSVVPRVPVLLPDLR
jgi:hypothetical protein